MLAYVHQFLHNWIFTLLVEIPVLILAVRYRFKVSDEKLSSIRLIMGGVFASTITIPWVWFIFPVFFYNSMTIAIIIGEAAAFAVETVFYMFAFSFSLRQSVIVSFIANVASFLLGWVAFQVV